MLSFFFNNFILVVRCQSNLSGTCLRYFLLPYNGYHGYPAQHSMHRFTSEDHSQHWENGISFPWLCLKTWYFGPIPSSGQSLSYHIIVILIITIIYFPEESCQLENRMPHFRQLRRHLRRQLRIILSFLENH